MRRQMQVSAVAVLAAVFWVGFVHPAPLSAFGAAMLVATGAGASWLLIESTR